MRFGLLSILGAFALVATGESAAPADDKAEVEKELKKFQGTWTIESSEAGGQKVPADQLKDTTVTFDGDKHTVKNGQRGDPSRPAENRPVQVTEDHRCHDDRRPEQRERSCSESTSSTATR